MGSIQKYCDRVILLNKGKQIIDATPKIAIDLFNQISVMEGQENVEQQRAAENHETNQEREKGSRADVWKQKMSVNPKTVEYGNRDAEIVDFCICNSQGMITNSINKGEEFSVMMRVRFNVDIQEPIFAFTIKDIKGTELTGSNTLLGNKMLRVAHAGETVEIVFKQTMNLRCNDYLLALGCTGYRDGQFTVYHRLYDICYVMVLSETDTVGLFDLYSDIEINVQ